ncbi:PQQ-dependent sugar dehydrogenase [Salinarchaeum laminariae]|uniref:PQQ-dependent sugar dehydrogenase n=1 Tax=Salinarchaeum laminariae TaxID=869888 RepID=UPI0020BEA0A1|nr:PQQ-dependent sugar dehydrogenase [Salinarchaeum laminariae]
MTPSTRMTRRRALGVAVGLAGCIDGTSDSDDGANADAGTDDGNGNGEALADVPDAVALEPVLTGIQQPVGTAFASADGLQYVVLQSGRVLGVDGDGQLDSPVLDLTESVESGGYEQGLLGIALHPEFASNRRAFLRYSAPVREGTPEEYSHTFVLAAFEATEDGTQFRPESERTILEIPEPQANHNAGDLAFGPDGHLYVPVGDGGAGGDQGLGHVDDWYDAVDGGNGQDVTENLLGSILRIDVDSEPGDDSAGAADQPYAIPEDNPLVGETGLDEHYAWGLRNPWGIAFDGEDCYVADVGQSSYEEVNLVEAGGNYGWNVREATHCYGADSCPDVTPADVRGGEPLLDPIVEYPHDGQGITGNSVIGGHVYRGDAIPELDGVYVFGDLSAQGRLFVTAAGENGDEGLWPLASLQTEGAGLQSIFAFGQDADGELYVLGSGDDGGGVWRIGPRG